MPCSAAPANVLSPRPKALAHGRWIGIAVAATIALVIALWLEFDGAAESPTWPRSLIRAAEWSAIFLLGLSIWHFRATTAPRKQFLTLSAMALFIVLFDAAIVGVWLPNTVFSTPDTPGYWDFSPIRTAGYPGLLHLFALAPDGLHDLVLFQFLVAGLATLALCHAILAVFRSAVAACGVSVLLTIKQGLIVQHLSLMSDSPFFSCCTTLLALGLLMLQRPGWRLVALIACISAAAVLLRPAALGIAAPLVVLGLLSWRRGHRRYAVGLAVSLSLAFTVNGVAQPIATAVSGIRGAGAGDIAALSLMGTAGFLLTADTPTVNQDLRDRLVPEAAPYRANWLAARGLKDKFRVLLPQADELVYNHALRVACEATQNPCRYMLTKKALLALRSLAVEAILHDPLGMLEIVWTRLIDDAQWSLSGEWISWQQLYFTASNETHGWWEVGSDRFAAKGYRLQPTAAGMAPDILGVAGWAYDHRPALNETILALCVGSMALAVCWIRSRPWQTDLIAVGWASTGPLAYNIVVSIGQSPFGRYTDAVFAWLLVIAAGSLVVASRALMLLWRRFSQGERLFQDGSAGS